MLLYLCFVSGPFAIKLLEESRPHSDFLSTTCDDSVLSYPIPKARGWQSMVHGPDLACKNTGSDLWVGDLDSI